MGTNELMYKIMMTTLLLMISACIIGMFFGAGNPKLQKILIRIYAGFLACVMLEALYWLWI